MATTAILLPLDAALAFGAALTAMQASITALSTRQMDVSSLGVWSASPVDFGVGPQLASMCAIFRGHDHGQVPLTTWCFQQASALEGLHVLCLPTHSFINTNTMKFSMVYSSQLATLLKICHEYSHNPQ
jgi:hypothetical protein